MRSVLAGGVASFAFFFLTSHLNGQVTSNSNDVVSTSAVFSLDDIVREVLTNNPSLKAATANWLAMKERIPQARAWAETEHGGQRAYLAWAARQGEETARVAEAVLPETDVDAVRVMTVHAAKGLEFAMVVLSAFT